MKKRKKKNGWFGILVIIALALIIGGNSQKETKNPDSPSFATDPVVNRFIIDFNAQNNNQIKTVEEGNIRTKYFVNIDGIYVELLNANDNVAEAFVVKFSAKKETDTVVLVNLFKKIAKILEPSIKDEMLNEGISTLMESNGITETRIGNTLLAKYLIGSFDLNFEIRAEKYK